MALYQSSIHHQPPEFDGTRISVMSAHTLHDGCTPDPAIVDCDRFDLHWPELAPSRKLVGDYYKRGLPLADLFSAYRYALETEGERQDKLTELAMKAVGGNVLVMCEEIDLNKCHRSVLLAVIEEHYPGVVIIR